MAGAGVLDLTFLEITNAADLSLNATEFIGNSCKESPSKTKQPWKALRLGNNSITEVSVFESMSSFADPQNVMWLDLSFNKIERIDESLAAIFPNVTTLYLHANQISKLSHIKKLSGLSKLKSLTLYGNPVEENKHYRNYILYCFPGLQQLDFCVITPGQRQKMASWSLVHRKSLNPEEYN